MGSIGAPEILVILVLALLVLGPDRLPQAARTAGKWMQELRKITSSLQAEMHTVVEEVMQPVQSTASAASEVYTSTVASASATETNAGDTGATPSETVIGVEDAPDRTATTDGAGPAPFDPSMN